MRSGPPGDPITLKVKCYPNVQLCVYFDPLLTHHSGNALVLPSIVEIYTTEGLHSSIVFIVTVIQLVTVNLAHYITTDGPPSEHINWDL